MAAENKTDKPRFLFKKNDYLLMIAGVVVIIIGFLLMAGGADNDPDKFKADQVYSFRRVTIAPLIVLLGYAIEVFAILRKPNINDTASDSSDT